MMFKLFLFLFLFSNLASAKEINLVYLLTYINNSQYDSGMIIHRVTIPQNTKFQKVLNIDTDGLKSSIKNHKNSSDNKYIEVMFNVPKFTKLEKRIVFMIDIESSAYTINKTSELTNNDILKYKLFKYIKPDKFIESDSREIKAIANIINKSAATLNEKIKITYEFVNEYLSYKRLNKRTSSLTGIKNGYGDCTEFSDLFVALCRAMNIPSRTVSLFNFKNKKSFLLPNHNEAEIYLKNIGWTLIYTNLGQGKYNSNHSLYKIADDNIVYSCDNVWTWSNYIKNKLPKGSLKIFVKWEVIEK